MKKLLTKIMKKIFSIEITENDGIAMEEKMKEDFSIIGKPFKIDNLIVAQYDFPSMMNWKDAKKACETLGNGWRLPTIDELNILYKNKDKIGCSALLSYWSSMELDNFAWAQFFGNGFEHDYIKNDPYYVRAVRSE
jgi:hypothetical protein